MIKITCTSCHKALSLDETKLPMKEVSFPCPVCKTKVTVDKRNLGAAAQPAEGLGGTLPPQSDDDDEFGSKAFIVGADQPALREAAKQIGLLPIHFAAAEQARDRFMQDPPQIVIISPPQMTPPPLEAMQPIIGLMPADRRKSFFVLFAENLRTLDGNAAFLYGVNLVVAQKDLGNFPQIYKDAYSYHERLYSKMSSVLRSIEGA